MEARKLLETRRITIIIAFVRRSLFWSKMWRKSSMVWPQCENPNNSFWGPTQWDHSGYQILCDAGQWGNRCWAIRCWDIHHRAQRHEGECLEYNVGPGKLRGFCSSPAARPDSHSWHHLRNFWGSLLQTSCSDPPSTQRNSPRTRKCEQGLQNASQIEAKENLGGCQNIFVSSGSNRGQPRRNIIT